MNSSKIQNFNRPSPIECYKLQLIGVYCILMLMLAVCFNSLLLLVFVRYKSLRTMMNMFVLTNTLLNLVGSILEFSLVIPSNFACK